MKESKTVNTTNWVIKGQNAKIRNSTMDAREMEIRWNKLGGLSALLPGGLPWGPTGHTQGAPGLMKILCQAPAHFRRSH